jgi:hypothetical protein
MRSNKCAISHVETYFLNMNYESEKLIYKGQEMK